MKKNESSLKIIVLFLFLSSLDASMGANFKEAPNLAPDTSVFDISIFFTGNIQGNIEPCG
jgi:hypothetical protein